MPEDYYDITKLYPVLESMGWKKAKEFMKYWACGESRIAKVDSGHDKSTVSINIGGDPKAELSVKEVDWEWFNKYEYVLKKKQELLNGRAQNEKVKKLLVSRYLPKRKVRVSNSQSQCRPSKQQSWLSKGHMHPAVSTAVHSKSKLLSHPDEYEAITHFNEWLVNGMIPSNYKKHIKQHQLQYIGVDPFELNGRNFDDFVAAINGFNIFSFYKGFVINRYAFHFSQYRKDNIPYTATSSLKEGIIKALNNEKIKDLLVVTHVGLYAGDIYEFNGSQYLGTWDTVNNTVQISRWDYLRRPFSGDDTDNPKDLSITNETFRKYRMKTGCGGDFVILTPIELKPCAFTIPVFF